MQVDRSHGSPSTSSSGYEYVVPPVNIFSVAAEHMNDPRHTEHIEFADEELEMGFEGTEDSDCADDGEEPWTTSL